MLAKPYKSDITEPANTASGCDEYIPGKCNLLQRCTFISDYGDWRLTLFKQICDRIKFKNCLSASLIKINFKCKRSNDLPAINILKNDQK